jgi:hypothetical protein
MPSIGTAQGQFHHVDCGFLLKLEATTDRNVKSKI